jgi:hypothetical protein
LGGVVTDRLSRGLSLRQAPETPPTVRGGNGGPVLTSLRFHPFSPSFSSSHYPLRTPVPLPQAVALSTVLAILNSTRSTDIPGLVAALDGAEQVRFPSHFFLSFRTSALSSLNLACCVVFPKESAQLEAKGCFLEMLG